MKASPPVLPIMTIEAPIEDDEKAKELASDTNTMVDKTDNEAGNVPANPIELEGTLALEDYPNGLQFLFILLALILSIFMVALDLVCYTQSTLLMHLYAYPACRPSSQQPSRRSRISFIASPRSDGMARPFS